MSERWRTAMVVSISILFVLLYVGALLGWAGLAPNEQALRYIQPVVWVIIGYYFGRVPGERTESRLKEQADKSEAAADAAQKAAGKAKVRLTATEEKLAAVRNVLRGPSPPASGMGVEAAGAPQIAAPAPSPVAAALRILESGGPFCDQCVEGAIQKWAGSPVNSLNDVLKDLYLAKHGPCDNGALRDLCDVLRQRCNAEVSVSELSGDMTVDEVTQVVCG